MNRERLIQNIIVSLRGLNGGRGCQQLVQRGLMRMDMEELVEFNQLVLSIQTTQSAKVMKGNQRYGYGGRRG
jgi:hypothetical protein